MFIAEVPTNLETITIPLGAGGTRATLKIMARVTKQARTDPVIRDTAKNLVMDCAPGDYRAEVECLFHFVRDHIRYLQDGNNMERLTYPTILLSDQAGDCDDKATLLASLLESIGHPCRFIALGYEAPGEFEHVYLETRIGNNWIACETTPIDGQSVDLGWYPAPPNLDRQITAKMIEHI